VDKSHRARLRVEIGRLRRLLRNVAEISATELGVPARRFRSHAAERTQSPGREKTRIEVGEHLLRSCELTDEKESPDFKVTRVSGVQSRKMHRRRN
jgi:hypothetical protein